jgi:murein tripeptide amidase MpaA
MDDKVRSQYVTRQTICKTLAGNKVDVLTITEAGSKQEVSARQGVVFTARVHPGESNSSFVMKGIIDFLTSEDNIEAIMLRRNFVFKIIPMINPDGVVYGNYRSSLSGFDLNRVWKKPNPTLFPEVYAIK